MGTPAQPDLIENVGKVSPPHCGHIRPPLLGNLVGGVRSGRGSRHRTQIDVTIFVGTALSDTYTTRKRINVAPPPAGRVAGVLHGMSGRLVTGKLVT